MGKKKYKLYGSDYFAERWTYQTKCCYKYQCNCNICPNDIVCTIYESQNTGVKVPYGIRPVKYAMLLTYARIGKPRNVETEELGEV